LISECTIDLSGSASRGVVKHDTMSISIRATKMSLSFGSKVVRISPFTASGHLLGGGEERGERREERRERRERREERGEKRGREERGERGEE
jgi:hypothetical protein